MMWLRLKEVRALVGFGIRDTFQSVIFALIGRKNIVGVLGLAVDHHEFVDGELDIGTDRDELHAVPVSDAGAVLLEAFHMSLFSVTFGHDSV